MQSVKKKRYIYQPMTLKNLYFFCFLSKKTKKREYLCYQKCSERYYGKVFNESYKKFIWIMLRKSLATWLRLIFFPILTLLLILAFISVGSFSTPWIDNREKRTLPEEEMTAISNKLQEQWNKEDALNFRKIVYKKKYIYHPVKVKNLYFFCFLSKKTKKREYLYYQICYQKYYGKVCKVSYKKFGQMMLKKSMTYCVGYFFVPIILILAFISIYLLLDFDTYWNIYRKKVDLSDEQAVTIYEELQKQWNDEDKLDKLKKESKKNNH